MWVKTARTVPKRGMPERRCSGTRRQELLISQQIDVGLRLATSARRTLLPVHGALEWSFTGHLLVHGAPLHQQLFGVVKHLACQSLGFRTSQPLVPGLFVFRSRHHHHHRQPYRVHRRATAGERLLATMQADASCASAARGLNGSFSFVNNAGTVFQQGSSQRTSKPNNPGHTVVVVVQGSCRDKRYDDLT